MGTFNKFKSEREFPFKKKLKVFFVYPDEIFYLSHAFQTDNDVL
jgi:hypothetical protein